MFVPLESITIQCIPVRTPIRINQLLQSEPKDLFKHLLESAICHQQHCTGVCDHVFVNITSRAMVLTVGMVSRLRRRGAWRSTRGRRLSIQ
jgi:hypothetical protein